MRTDGHLHKCMSPNCNKETRNWRYCSRTCFLKYRNSKITWNRGLTKDTDKRVKKNAENISKAMIGLPRSKTHCENLSKARNEYFKNPKAREKFSKASIKAYKEGRSVCPLIGKGISGESTKEEKIMKPLLSKLGFKSEIVFGTGQGGMGIYGVPWYCADFYHPIVKLIIELDGSSHLMKGRREKDKRKDSFFKDKEIKVIRFDVSKIFEPKKILKRVLKEMKNYVKKN